MTDEALNQAKMCLEKYDRWSTQKRGKEYRCYLWDSNRPVQGPWRTTEADAICEALLAVEEE